MCGKKPPPRRPTISETERERRELAEAQRLLDAYVEQHATSPSNQETRDAAYRRALGLDPGDPFPKRLGTVHAQHHRRQRPLPVRLVVR